MADAFGPVRYASPNRRPSGRLNDINQLSADAVEGEIRAFVRRDALLRRQRSEVDTANNPAAEALHGMIRRLAGTSIGKIDQMIRDLEHMREMLRNEGERVCREVAGYATLSHAAVLEMNDIGDSLNRWKDIWDKSGPRSAR